MSFRMIRYQNSNMLMQSCSAYTKKCPISFHFVLHLVLIHYMDVGWYFSLHDICTFS